MLEKRLTACPMDCPDTCSLEVEVENERVQKISASPLNPVTNGFICSKVANFTKRLYASDRILHPMVRRGQKGDAVFEKISWDEAVALICEKFRRIRDQFGGESILPFSYGGSNGILAQDTVDRAFFAKMGASQLARTVCAAPTSAAHAGMYGKMPGVAFEDYVQARFIIIWGANAKASNIHLVPFLKQAKENGAKIAVIDPRLNFSSREYDLHLPVYPGTDLAVALAMINYWREKNLLNRDFIDQHCINSEKLLDAASSYSLYRAASIARVEASQIEKLANMYAESDPALIRVGWGLERNRNGGKAAAAILALPALMGKFGVKGGGFTLSNSAAAKIINNKLVDSQPWNTREINMNLLGHALLEEKNPPVMAMYVYNCNPLATMPNQTAVLKGLRREDLFTVVHEQILTDTARYADVLLPCVTFLEQHEIKKSYGAYGLHYLAPVIPACGESKPNEEVFALLGRTMGWNDQAFQDGTEEYMERAVGAIRGMGRPIELAELKEKRMLHFDFPGRSPVQFQTVFPWTNESKVNLAPAILGEHPYEYIPGPNGFPLALISPATNKTISSTMGEYNIPQLFLSMNPEDARSRHISDGMKVKAFNEYGEVHCILRIQPRLRPGVVAIPKGAWRKSSLNQMTANALSPDTLGTAGGACFNDARVEVEAL
jgi:anaerobic selenocysteine-containing dehydrogenase